MLRIINANTATLKNTDFSTLMGQIISGKNLKQLSEHPNSFIRYHVVRALSGNDIPLKMINDTDSIIRWVVAGKINIKHVHKMMNDPDETVRWCVVHRIESKYLNQMLKDPEPHIRIRAQQRIEANAIYNSK